MARVMVVDDTDIHREALARLLRRQGYETLTAGDTDDAVRLLDRGHDPPDVILVDVKPAGHEGLDLLETLHDDPRWRPLPVVLLTGCSDTHCLNRAAQLGAKRASVRATCSLADAMACVREYAN